MPRPRPFAPGHEMFGYSPKDSAFIGMNLDYLGDYTDGPIYYDGDIVIGPDNIAYMCVVDGTTTPPEPWPGVGISASVGPPGPQGPVGPTGPQGAPGVSAAVDATYWTVSAHPTLTNERALNALANGYVKSTAGEPSTVAVIPVAEGGTSATDAATARINLGVGNVGTLNLNGNPGTFLNGSGTWTVPPVPVGIVAGMMILSIYPCPPGYTRVGGWDGYYPRFGPVHTSGGAFSHSHGAGSYYVPDHAHGVGSLTVPAHAHNAGTLNTPSHNHGGVTGSVTVGFGITISGTTGSGGGHSHSFSAGTNSSGSNMNVDAGSSGNMARSDHVHSVSGDTDSVSNHSHSFSGSGSGSGSGTGSIPNQGSMGINGATANSAAVAVTGATAGTGNFAIGGASDAQANNPAFIDFYACLKD